MKRIASTALLSCVIACAGANAPEEDGDTTGLDLSGVRMVDLSHAYGDDTLFWPTSPSVFEHTELHYGLTEAGYFYSAYTFCTPEHGGTHIDAPVHFSEDGWPLGDVPIERLIAPGVIIEVSEKASQDRDYRLSREDVEQWETANGRVPSGAIVLLRTGWSEFWPDAMGYLGNDTPGDASDLHFPAYGAEAARLLVDERDVAALGIDTASIDYGPSADFVVHQIAAAKNVVSLENVTNLGSLPATGAWILALPMKITKGSGGPLRIVALVP